jgi:HSP20 family protein
MAGGNRARFSQPQTFCGSKSSPSQEHVMPIYRSVPRTGFAYPLDELRDELDRLWTSLTTAPPLHGWSVRPSADLFPAVNVCENDDCITVEAELPGLDAGDVEIAVSGDELVLKGGRPETQPTTEQATADAATGPGNGERQKAVTWHRRERGTGRFERRLTLPTAVDAGRVDAKLVDGVLTVTCPKAPERQPHKVPVRPG